MTYQICRIEWYSTLTGFESHGDWFDISKLPVLEAWKKEMNAKYPDLIHRVVIENGTTPIQ